MTAPTVVTAASAFTAANRLLVAGGADRTSDDSGLDVDTSALRINDAGGEFTLMAGTTAKTSQTSQTASTTEQTLHSEAQKSGILDVAGSMIHCRAFGTWEADASPPVSWTFRLKYGSTAIWSVNPLVGGGAYTGMWMFIADVITTSSGNTRAYGWFFDYNLGSGTVRRILRSDIAIAATPTTTGAVTVALTHEWTAIDAGSNFVCEMCTFNLGGLRA